jgi:hypothetical protein
MDFFVVNSTENKTKLIIKFSEPIEFITQNTYNLQLNYIDSILNIDNNTHKLLSKKLTYTQINTNTISVDIPEKSTVLIGSGSNRPIMADSLTFITNEIPVKYSHESIYKYTKRTKGLFSTIHYTYSIDK